MKTLLFIICVLIQHTLSANILAILSMPSKSHHIWNRVLMKGLAARGHNVTALSVDTDLKSTPGLHYIKIEGVYEPIMEFYGTADIEMFSANDPTEGIKQMYQFYDMTCEYVFKSNGVRELMSYPKNFRFDLIIHDITCGQCLLGFVPHFGSPPLVSISAFSMPFISGKPQFPALVPLFNLPFPDNMDFWQRTRNLYYHAVEWYYRYFYFLPSQNVHARKYFGADLQSLESVEQNTSVTLVNIDAALDVPQPLMPNIIPVGGLHIEAPKKLPEDIASFLAGAEDGAILFSLGSNLQSILMDSKRIEMFLEAFRRFPKYRVLWKFESDTLTNIPPNVMIRDWLPQNDILAHSNIRLFMTHGGLLSTQEACWHGVPLLGMPFFVDQHQNMAKSVAKGVAEMLDYKTLAIDNIVNKIRQITTDQSYLRNARHRGTIFRDQLSPPLTRALHWTEYVIRHRGAKHLQTLATSMPLYQFLMLDVLGVVLGAIAVILVFLFKGCVGNRSRRNVNKQKYRKSNSKKCE